MVTHFSERLNILSLQFDILSYYIVYFKVVTEADTEVVTEADTEVVTEADTEADTEVDMEVVTEAVTGADTEVVAVEVLSKL